MTDHTSDLVLRAGPFFTAALLFYGWAMLVALQTGRERWDALSVCLVAICVTVGTYLLALALGFSSVYTLSPDVYDVVRVCVGVAALIGLPVTYRQIWRILRGVA